MEPTRIITVYPLRICGSIQCGWLEGQFPMPTASNNTALLVTVRYRLPRNYRHWIFRSDNFEHDVPKWANGVVGRNPVIEPGMIFQYMSMVHLEAPRGTMEGAFLLECKASGQPFEVKVDLCELRPEVYTDR
jgi:hypothetical protein